jgi:hypothetical protein
MSHRPRMDTDFPLLAEPSSAWWRLALRYANAGRRWRPCEAACQVPLATRSSWRIATDTVTGEGRSIVRIRRNPPGSIGPSSSVRGEIRQPGDGHPRRPGRNGAKVPERPSSQRTGESHGRRMWPWPDSEVSW